MSNQVKIDLVVTRHAPLVVLLRERGIITDDTPVIEHATASDVEGRHVIGVLPHWLSSVAASVTEIPMRTTPADREAMTRGDIGIERLRAIADAPARYVVEQMRGGGIHPTRPRWLAVARAYEHVERIGQHFGSGPAQLAYADVTWRGLHVAVIGDGAQTVSAEVIESRGVWRPDCRGPWLDGYGREVADDGIAPAAGWTA